MLNSKFTYRLANHDDLAQLNQLMHLLHHEHYIQAPSEFKTAQEIEKSKSISLYLDSPECLVLVCEYQQSLFGFVTAQLCEFNSPISPSCLMGSVDELYVVNKYRQQGIATRLLSDIQQRLTEWGATQIMVEVWDFNQSALKLYKECGFVPHIHCLKKSI
ncbi:GNAT family N-acetyltransferase [Vibrio hippocampi]|uniref:N-acetyltransferase domain-containing protein n=1 Tax=Vibrio hippocampi TaxID=654686 RepID=A0ABN8DFJ6_9VIBR|nr:GNAT family N-acetyltransferase [Vibrio hippocampi]CAH0526036.1 hypothetical protein VHP8226_01522 [Vibrio hippocampi]